MPKLTHSDADAQVEAAMRAPTSLALESLEKFLSNRGKLPTAQPNVPRFPTEQIKRLPLKIQ